MPAFDVLTNPTSLPPLKPGEKKTIVVTATSRLTRAVTGRAVPFVEPRTFAAMVKPPAKQEQSFAQAGQTQEFPFSVEIPADAKAGSFTVRIDVVDVEHQDDNFGQSPVLKVVIEPPPPPPPPNGKKKPWWFWVLIGVGVLILGVVVYLFTRPKNGMPNVVGKSFAAAESLLTAKQVGIVRRDTLNTDTSRYRPTVVIEQHPAGGSRLKPDTNTDTLHVQLAWSVVPTLMGETDTEAARRVGAAGLNPSFFSQCTTVHMADEGKVVWVSLGATSLVPAGTGIQLRIREFKPTCPPIRQPWTRAEVMTEFNKTRRTMMAAPPPPHQ